MLGFLASSMRIRVPHQASAACRILCSPLLYRALDTKDGWKSVAFSLVCRHTPSGRCLPDGSLLYAAAALRKQQPQKHQGPQQLKQEQQHHHHLQVEVLLTLDGKEATALVGRWGGLTHNGLTPKGQLSILPVFFPFCAQDGEQESPRRTLYPKTGHACQAKSLRLLCSARGAGEPVISAVETFWKQVLAVLGQSHTAYPPP
eukprot:1160198-Pelagomonas_calceolata.AAC.10